MTLCPKPTLNMAPQQHQLSSTLIPHSLFGFRSFFAVAVAAVFNIKTTRRKNGHDKVSSEHGHVQGDEAPGTQQRGVYLGCRLDSQDWD